tara:strand:- start:367 stop:1095 length:729 start_codon:yes stop_codon:yes gene_type:complete
MDKMIKDGSLLFKYRGQTPIILFIIAIPIVKNTHHHEQLSLIELDLIQYMAVTIALTGLLLRYITIGTSPAGTSGKNRNKQVADKLNTKGIYSIVRNPLYLGNYLIWVGISIYSTSYIFTLITSIFFFFQYERIILTEEQFLAKKYGDRYREFLENTPLFLPNFFKYQKSKNRFSFKSIIRQEYSSTLSTICAFIYIDVLMNILFSNLLHDLLIEKYIKILCVSIIVTLILKIIKSYTKILS